MEDVQFRPLEEQNLLLTVDFIATINNLDASHIGYCGRDRDEIESFLINELTDVPYTKSFVCSFHDEQLIGVVGFDADMEDQSAEIWGPFIKADLWSIIDALWSEVVALLPNEIESLYMFPNTKNKQAIAFAKKNGFNAHSSHQILSFSATDRLLLPETDAHELTDEFIPEMIALHDKTFPEAYYSGAQIIDRIQTNRRVLMVTEGSHLSGYIYLEADPEFGDASIEFFAVGESDRGKGIGHTLLVAGLNWLTTFATIEEIKLTVNEASTEAIRLYQRAGFQAAHKLQFLIKEK